MINWRSTGHSWILNLAGGFITAAVSYSVTRGEQYVVRVNGEQLKGDFQNEDVAKEAALLWVKGMLLKAQAEIEFIPAPTVCIEQNVPLLDEQVLKILTGDGDSEPPTAWTPTEIADKIDTNREHGFRFLKAIISSLEELERQGKVTLTRDKGTIRCCSVNRGGKGRR